MLFEALHDAAKRGELLLVEGAFCHWHLRRDGQLTICEIIVLPDRQGEGIGREIVRRLAGTEGATSILAKCPSDLPANEFYRRLGFAHEATETTKTGRQVNVWRLRL
jgi:GNAT superfamily N-acetyltransferase